MNAEEIINFNKKALYSSLTGTDTSGRFFNKSILHYAVSMEIFSYKINAVINLVIEAGEIISFIFLLCSIELLSISYER